MISVIHYIELCILNCYGPSCCTIADPRRPYPQDIEMRSGFLGGFSPPAPQSEQGKFGSDMATSEPPEKKIALEKSGSVILQGIEICTIEVCLVPRGGRPGTI